jgi:hypothetical protein
LRLVAVKFRSGANFVFEEIFVYIFCLFLYTMHDIFSCTHNRKIVTGNSHTYPRMRTRKETKMRYGGHP